MKINYKKKDFSIKLKHAQIEQRRQKNKELLIVPLLQTVH